jgi:hypothetical protein
MAEGKGKWTSVFKTGGNRFIIRNERRADVASIPTKVEGAADYANLFVTAVNTYPAAEALVKALEDWLYYAKENLSEFDYEDCHAEKLCHRCESSGCINLKIRNARSALSRFRSLQNGGAND